VTFLSRDLRHQHTRREQIRALRDTERELALVPNPKASRAPKHETDHDRALTLGLRLDTKIGKWCRACHGLRIDATGTAASAVASRSLTRSSSGGK